MKSIMKTLIEPLSRRLGSMVAGLIVASDYSDHAADVETGIVAVSLIAFDLFFSFIDKKQNREGA